MQIEDTAIIDALQKIGRALQLAESHEVSIKELYGRMNVQETSSARSEETVKSIKCSIDEVKSSINEMKASLSKTLESSQEKIDKLKNEPLEDLKDAKRRAIGAIITAVIVAGVGIISFVVNLKNNQETAAIKQQYEIQLKEYQKELQDLKLERQKRGDSN